MPDTIPAADMFALDDFETEDVARMQIIPPGKFASIGWIDFAGPGHSKSKQMADEQSRKRLFEERQRQIMQNRYKPAEKTPEEVDREFVKMVVDRIVGWSIKGRGKDEDGEEVFVDIPFTHETAMTLMLDRRKGWVFGQCAEFLGAVENFMPASSQS